MPDALDQVLTQLHSSPPGAPLGAGGTGAPSPATPAPSPQPVTGGGSAPKDHGAAGAAILGAVDSATFGLADEAGGLLDTVLPSFTQQADDPRENVWNSKGSFGDILSKNIAKNRAVEAQARQDHTGAFIGGQLGGALLVPFGAGAKGALQVAKVGAVSGAAYGAGSGEGVAGRLEGAAEGAAAGGLLGGALGAIGSRVGKLLGRGAEEAAAPVEEGLTGETTDTSPNVQGWTEPNLRGDRSPVVSEPATPAPEDELVPLHDEPRPIAKDGEPIESTTPGDGKGPEGEPVGSISRAGLQDLQTQVEQFRGQVASQGDRAVDLPADAPQGQFRIGNLGDGPDTISLLGALVRQLPSKVGRTDEELMATAKAASDQMGTQDPEAVYALAQQVAGPLGDADTAMAVLRTVARRAAADVDGFHQAGIDWSTATDEMVQQAGQSIYNSQRLNSLLQSAKIGVGRGLRTMQLPDADTYLAALAKGERVAEPVSERSIPPLPGNREDLSDFFDLWGMTKGNPEQQHDLLAGTLTVPSSGHYLANSFANMFTASILSSPKTVLLNVIGPAVINTTRALEKMGGAAWGAIDPLATPEERMAAAAVAKATPLALYRTLADIQDVFRSGVQAFETNHSVIGGGGTVRDAHVTFGPYNSNFLAAAGVDPTFLQRTGYTLGNAINIFPKAFARVNAGLDEMAKRFTYLNEVRVRAMVEAATQGLTGDDAHAFVSQAMKASVDEAGHATSESLLRGAERTTLTYQPGAEGDKGATLARKFSQGVQTLRTEYPLSRFILPVFTVPANGIGETLRRLPGYNRMPWMVEHAADLAGDNGPVSQAEAHGRTILGASFLTAAYLYNQAGMVTGGGPQNPVDARIWRQTHEPYSVRVGDTWVSYRKLDILGGLLSIPATLSDASVYHQVDDKGLMHTALMGVGTLATWFKDQGSMRQATDFLALGDNPMKDPETAFERMFGNAVAGLAPASAFIRTMGVDTTDPYVRAKRGWEDYIKAGVPGWGQAVLEPLRNVLGEPVNRPNNTLGEAIFPVTLAPVQTYAKDPVLDELTRLYQVTGYGAGADPKSWLYGFADPQDVKLEDGRSLYFHAMQARATAKLDGQTLRQALSDLINTPDYNAAVDADSGQRVTSNGDESRGYLVRQTFDRYNKAIKATLANSSPTALRYLTAAAAKQRDDAYLRTVTVDQLAQNPDLYRTHGVDGDAYAQKITEGSAGELLDALGAH